ncbi:ABC transporter permease [Saccharibacillus kuerlensis]|uniref:Iron export ABC transporter permease subunit FetB n=1 Tax=Saccharibacillus kuerlensis TaxID=459527 RepID=A0ABQ2L463_9BACL|nr:iron export ABC transporter permease subunit FetB [Saccharibacillus kuerlensis]GGO02253.1 iron export ABC transporter permease subunit FetB [Saccharibacillus kuerlensis]
MNGTIDIVWWQLGAAYIFVLILMLIVRIKGIRREREIAIASIRMTVQLIAVGYILEYVFGHANPYTTLLIIAVMLAFAVHTIIKRSKNPLSRKMKQLIALSMLSGFIVSLCVFLFVILGLRPWYEPRYVIPIAGMIIGNSMTGIALGVNTLTGGMRARKSLIEAALMFGASPKMACRSVVNDAFDAAMLPTLNSMIGMGIVFLPGMMTGQILGGASPLMAIEYQIAIMLSMVGSVSLSVILFVQLGYKQFFNKRAQLIE